MRLKTYDDIYSIQSSPGNGNDDIYWVAASVLDKYRDQ
jgi:hypothetical protein